MAAPAATSSPNIIDTQQVREKRAGKTSERANWSDRNTQEMTVAGEQLLNEHDLACTTYSVYRNATSQEQAAV